MAAINPRPSPPQLPEQFGRYRIVRKLGQGGMGSVYLARDTQLDRQVALKVPHIRPEDGPAVLERFYREARAAATLHHPNLCPVHDVGSHDGVPYLTMAFIEGKPLSAFVAEGGLPPRQVAAVVRKLALALQEAHARGIVHRDLKPANVMIDRRKEPVIMDFGLARRGGEGEARLTKLGAVLGTPSYMAPEQVKGDPGLVGPACDVYALGVILYELLTGQLPFEGPVMAVLGQVLTQEPEPPSKLRPGLDPALEAICLKAMAKRPADRYASMQELAEALTGYLRATGQAAPAPMAVAAAPAATAARAVDRRGPDSLAADLFAGLDAETAPPARSPQRRPLWPWLAAGAVVVAAAAVGGIALLVWLPGRTAAPQAKEHEPPTPGPKGTTQKPGVVPPKPGITPAVAALPKEVENSIGMKLVLVPTGKFKMGSTPQEREQVRERVLGLLKLRETPDWLAAGLAVEGPQHEVEITRPFYLGAFEVTQEQYQKVMGKAPSWFSATGKGKDEVAGLDTRSFPVESVSWDDAVEFCEKLSALPTERKAGRTYRLPTEAEWEYACRGGAPSAAPFHVGASLATSQANFGAGGANFGAVPEKGALRRTCPVGSYKPNAWGLYDMHGNVHEWCADWFDKDYYATSPKRGPQGPSSGSKRVVRGGNWVFPAHGCRTAFRDAAAPDVGGRVGGFRVVCSTRDLPLPPFSLAGRTGAARERLLREGGGGPKTEDAVGRGLAWLVRQQREDGSWSGEEHDPGHGKSATGAAGTALALLPLLGAGHTPTDGKYAATVGKGIDSLLRAQQEDGGFSGSAYQHALPTIALCEAYALMRDPRLKGPAQGAIDFLVKAQHEAGGWRYKPGQEGDTSCTGWGLVALKTGQAARLNVPNEALERVSRFLDSKEAPDGSGYGYVGRDDGGPATSAIGLLCRMYLGWGPRDARLLKGLEALERAPAFAEAPPNAYSDYFATQVMRHAGGEHWKSWQPKMRDWLLARQATGGGTEGSWSPVGDAYGKQGGRLMTTSFALLTLEAYYRHAPLAVDRPAQAAYSGRVGRGAPSN
jgi:formylglycine-generating enzyme required for sulfatase activity